MRLIKEILFILFSFSFPLFSFSQDYFQQEVNYSIEVKLDDVKHELTAFETIEYTNNSPNELTFIYFHLWPNAYKNIHTAFAKQFLENGDDNFYYSAEKDKGYIDQLDFRINGTSAEIKIDPAAIDIGKLILNEPLKPGQKISISTPFHVKIPKTFSRMGHMGQQYQITQWYPKPAVYDKDGWHQFSYVDQGEFYSEYGNFNVKITVPKNYLVAATGNLQTESEIQWLDSIAKEEHSFRKDNSSVVSSTETKTLEYKQDNVHDFAWFCDKTYTVMKSEVELPHSKRKVTTWSFFTRLNAPIWQNATKYVNDALYYYSLWNGDYPYDNCTAVDGSLGAGGGMEYPTITVISSGGDDIGLEEVVLHEVGHNWFYGILGSNEQVHPWMDEGLNSFNELRYMELKHPEMTIAGSAGTGIFGTKDFKHKEQFYFAYILPALKNSDQPIELHAKKYSSENYGAIVYAKSAMAFNYLKNYLGAEIFDKAMQQYFETWKFKHPQPDDLRKIIEEVSGKKSDWFFDELLKTSKHLDYKIVSFKNTKQRSCEVKIVNKGEITGPVLLNAYSDTSLVISKVIEGFKGKQNFTLPVAHYTRIEIDHEHVMPEINRKNNIIRTKGICKKTEPVKFKFLTSLPNPGETHIYTTPIVGWNMYNKFMIGAAIHNYTITEKKFEYILAPMFATNNKDLAGYAGAFVNFHPRKIFQKISVGFNAARFCYYDIPFSMNFNKISPEINFIFKNKNARSPVTRTLKLRNVNLYIDSYTGDYSFSPPIYTPDQTNLTINEISFESKNTRLINPRNSLLKIQQGKGFAKASLETNYSITFKKKKSVDIRFFAGAFLDASAANAGNYRFRTSGWAGYQDYLYDHIFTGRNESKGILAQQFVENDGGLKVFTPIGQTTKWLAALNIKSSLPGILPIRLFADIAITDKDARLYEAVHFDGGVILTLVKDIFEIYFPLVMSNDLKQNLKIRDIKYGQQVRFTLNLNKLNPIEIIKNIKPGG